jgi:hypothetical protein
MLPLVDPQTAARRRSFSTRSLTAMPWAHWPRSPDSARPPSRRPTRTPRRGAHSTSPSTADRCARGRRSAASRPVRVIPAPNGRQLVLLGGACRPSATYLTVRDIASGQQWTLGADVSRCTGIGPAAWDPTGTRLVFPYAPEIGSAPADADFCNGDRLAGLVIAAANRTSTSRSWKVIHADPHCGFVYGVFDPRGIAAVEECDYGQPRLRRITAARGRVPAAALRPTHHKVTQRIPPWARI